MCQTVLSAASNNFRAWHGWFWQACSHRAEFLSAEELLLFSAYLTAYHTEVLFLAKSKARCMLVSAGLWSTLVVGLLGSIR